MSMYENIGMTSLDYINEIQRLQADVAKLTVENEKLLNKKAKIQWVSVKDRLPEIGKSVLIYYPKWDGDEIQVAKLEDDGMMFDICGEFNIGTGVVTHWMPLPEPPKESTNECVYKD